MTKSILFFCLLMASVLLNLIYGQEAEPNKHPTETVKKDCKTGDKASCATTSAKKDCKSADKTSCPTTSAKKNCKTTDKVSCATAPIKKGNKPNSKSETKTSCCAETNNNKTAKSCCS